MVEARARGRALGLLGTFVLSVMIPACSSPGCPPFPWLRRPNGDSTNVVQRPIYQDAEKRPFRLGGYAGASYGPFPARRLLPAGSPVDAVPGESRSSVSVSEGSWEQD
jgi:hypothetical protein